MPNRILKVNAYTTLDLVDGTAKGHDFEESAFAVLNVTSPRKNPDEITLGLELDGTQLDALPPHADTVTLSPEEARTLAADLEKHADRVEAARDD
ncbi:hypothetical protein E6P09_02100 [Haloferax mediterranei ATCC 33500]|uniref:Uncharacterized protein n=1 Tax=Haloferax mediterranei (strain ATCC 33500 / DSM 1411 / JCM 8866 / NBRC 14739 / NCIMB 2177 / R-4) TaxID=523841 RepID=I3R5V4_HALMT|nr:DUF6360 family protein [Haloferax mediterranei]AFK19614.1 hypothetical protein HFX_1917 [Haloferax mediterranei ATCC 33500]AHZ23005.1 hypothetical protein BM92_10305 [Haloferax mediterranei ATCC 33500]ELZ99932.1 hypothetical protein C439_11373 [Haloferax mediterranei ATCC 33500]MDX5987645.1 DUF6360 family protein [Haloferax mediterranei ATCC 33500]QCQ74131.1 hypothetical protein E6P09_02100 [Haloferax mediterranei ATCC 33500]